MNAKTIALFWSHVDKSGDCWLWTASKRNKGYGAFVWADDDGNVINGRAHRFSYELHVGPIPDRLFVLHRCDTPSCVNPAHLFLGTNADNVRDMIAKGRKVAGGTYTNGHYPRGTNHWNAKLTDAQVEAVRASRAEGLSYSQVARRHGISQSHAWRINNGHRRNTT